MARNVPDRARRGTGSLRAVEHPLHVLTVCGSLRADSWNQRVLDLVAEVAGPAWRVERGSVRDLPLYDQDLEDAGAPEPVARLRAQVLAADAVLFAGPQFNHGISGVLKNAVDWLSRPAFAGVLVDKPVTALAVTPGRHEPVEALGQTEVALEICVARVHRPGLALTSIRHHLDEDGRFDADVRTAVEAMVDGFGRFVVTPPEPAEVAE